MRERTPRVQHEKWAPAPDRRDPVSLILESGRGRIQELLPIRYGRMMVSPFTFYRGTADIMAADLAPMPVSGLHAQNLRRLSSDEPGWVRYSRAPG